MTLRYPTLILQSLLEASVVKGEIGLEKDCNDAIGNSRSHLTRMVKHVLLVFEVKLALIGHPMIAYIQYVWTLAMDT